MQPRTKILQMFYASAAVCCALIPFIHSSLGTPSPCPNECSCDAVVVDCSNRKLSTIPEWKQSHSSPANTFNFSFNFLNSVEELPFFSSNFKTLDLSFNEISAISSDIFSADKERFSGVTALNLTSNKLTNVGFDFPPSLLTLKLGSNAIPNFCVENLKDLTNLRTFSFESNGLKTLTSKCEEDKKRKGNNKNQAATKKHEENTECPFPPFQQIVEVLLQGNKLKTLNLAAVRCFQNAHIISLADNAIKTIPVDLFENFPNLRYLDLSGNSLSDIPHGTFQDLPNLKFLSLARNQLFAVPSALPMLEWLDLSDNSISHIPESQKSDLYAQEVFLIGSNPLHCDCELLWLKELFDTREYLLKFVDTERSKFIPSCSSPASVQGESWDVLGDDMFGCGKDGKEVDKKAKQSSHVQGNGILYDLSFKVKDFGTTYVRFDWDGKRETASAGQEPKKLYISHHPFGNKADQVSVAVQLSLGTHRLRDLEPGTAYIVCFSKIDPSTQNSKGHLGGDDCVEVVTKSNEQLILRDIYFRVGVVILGFVILIVKCSCTSGSQRDISSRRKED